MKLVTLTVEVVAEIPESISSDSLFLIAEFKNLGIGTSLLMDKVDSMVIHSAIVRDYITISSEDCEK